MSSKTGSELVALFFSNVGPDLAEDKYDWWSTRDVRLDPEVRQMFVEYFQEILSKDYTKKCYPATISAEEDASDDISELLSNLTRLQLPQDYDQFEKVSLSLAKRLCTIVDKRTHVNVIFVCLVEYGQQRYVCILNLDPEERDQFKINRKRKSIEYRVYRDLLPRRDSLQKGVIYPHPSNPLMDIKIVQRSPAVFFNRYFQAHPVLTTREAASKIFSVITSTLDEPLTLDDAFSIYRALKGAAQGGPLTITRSEISNLIQRLFPSLDADEVNNRLKEEKVESATLSSESVSSLKLVLKVDSGNFRGKIEGMINDLIHVRSSGRNTLTIESVSFKTTITR